MVVNIRKNGYLIAIILNAVESGILAVTYVAGRSIYVASGIIVPIGTVVMASMIFVYEKHLHDARKMINEQKEELYSVYENLIIAEKEIGKQTIRLFDNSTTMKEKEEDMQYLEYIDVLTELPNCKMIISRLELLVSLSDNRQGSFAVVFIDLDNFKRINDSRGYHAGDILLQQVVSRMNNLISQQDMLGRLGGDEFAIIIQRNLRDEDIFEYIDVLRTALQEPFIIEYREVCISASFGISIFLQDGTEAEELIRCADTAMYKAKNEGRNGIQFFSKEMQNEILAKIKFENSLQESLQNKELFLMFQPQYSADTKKLRGFEALARWQSPEYGLVNPADFIPVAEGTGYIVPMGEWILKTACEMIKFIHEKYAVDIVISVNISSVQIMNPSFVQMVKNIMKNTQVSGICLELEITESICITSVDYVIEVINELKKSGIQIALDDFGTGYSSLSYLEKLSIDTLKIDKSFIDSITNANVKKRMVGSIISLVHKMEISVVAEGVENLEQLNYLKEHNCDFIQGFLWGKPMSEAELHLLFQ